MDLFSFVTTIYLSVPETRYLKKPFKLNTEGPERFDELLNEVKKYPYSLVGA